VLRTQRPLRGRRSERRPLASPGLPSELARLLSPEVTVLLGLLWPSLTQASGSEAPIAKALQEASTASDKVPSDTVASDDPEEAPSDVAPETSQTPSTQKKTKRHRVPGSGRRPIPAAVRRFTQELLPSADELCCPGCQHTLHRIGERVTEQWDWHPGSYLVRRLVRPEFACTHCKGAGVVCVELPTQPIEGSHAGAGLIAHLVVSKFCDGLPLYRQQQMAAREGIALGRNTMSRWLKALGPAVRTLVDRVLWPALYQAPQLHTDATGLPVLAQGGVQRGHAFVYLAEGNVALFRYAPHHTTEAARHILGPYGGIVLCDGATIYDALFCEDQACRRAGCWSHARRHLVDARATDPARADQALAWIAELFAIDRETATLPSQARTEARALRSMPVLAKLQGWIAEQLPQLEHRSLMAKSLRYIQRQWERLTRFVTEGSIPLTNNAAERQLRRISLGRKNWLFCGSDVGAEDAMAWLSLLATCILRGIEPWSYLKWLLERLPGWDQRHLQDLSPWAFQQSQQGQEQAA
jgi:transposase